jgi:hypothetical protein
VDQGVRDRELAAALQKLKEKWAEEHPRLAVRYNREAITVLGLLHLACSLICVRFRRCAELTVPDA